MNGLAERISANGAQIRERMSIAAAASGRSAEAVRLVAVTKYVGLLEIEALYAAGFREFGESRPQSLWDRTAAFPAPDVAWHLIGHLQRNKTQRTLPLVKLIHSVDSVRLLEAIDSFASAEQPTRVLLEVNVSGDASKYGFSPDELEPLLPGLLRFPNIQVQGLMTMASLTGGIDTAQRNFAALRELRDQLARNAPPQVSLAELSMGMSGDFEVAIREGATMVRIGSALFQ